ncbi:MAG: hypothetical protein CVV64_14180 [Candidatus Wallbacteria bacterium HGW-Wallbacteria-1]|jgi:hypothetical protein|uniref:Uncharacterized protein n=1 Tax=Candidatus Wallbacteria bacterium HGW-Wallbacteria-1 TaxID=2013854 RepID=A0A2N1PM63_9BACT|nr:MAG: hypothetical protein CVV64_14180 [Candidatus Wallbacteria bacterium HGW-Wallbacteria-1]
MSRFNFNFAFALLACLLTITLVPESAFSSTDEIIRDFRWIGIGSEDRVGPGTKASSDGVKDAHFQVVLNLSNPAEITELRVYVSDAAGNRGGEFWHSNSYGYAWILGVWRNGKFLNPSPGKSLGTFSGPVLFDLFANDSGRLASYSHFRLELDIQGQTLTKLITSGKTVNAISRGDLKIEHENAESGKSEPDKSELSEKQPLPGNKFSGTPDTVMDHPLKDFSGSDDFSASSNSENETAGGLFDKYGFSVGTITGGSGVGALYKVQYRGGNIVGNYYSKSDHIDKLDGLIFFLTTCSASVEMRLSLV